MAWKAVREACLPMFGGLGVGVALSLGAAEPTWKTWFFWGCTAVVMPTLVFVITYVAMKRRSS